MDAPYDLFIKDLARRLTKSKKNLLTTIERVWFFTKNNYGYKMKKSIVKTIFNQAYLNAQEAARFNEFHTGAVDNETINRILFIALNQESEVPAGIESFVKAKTKTAFKALREIGKHYGSRFNKKIVDAIKQDVVLNESIREEHLNLIMDCSLSGEAFKAFSEMESVKGIEKVLKSQNVGDNVRAEAVSFLSVIADDDSIRLLAKYPRSRSGVTAEDVINLELLALDTLLSVKDKKIAEPESVKAAWEVLKPEVSNLVKALTDVDRVKKIYSDLSKETRNSLRAVFSRMDQSMAKAGIKTASSFGSFLNTIQEIEYHETQAYLSQQTASDLSRAATTDVSITHDGFSSSMP